MHKQKGSNQKKTIAWILVILGVAIVLLIVFAPFKKTEQPYNPVLVSFQSAALYKTSIDDGVAILGSNGYATINLERGEYTLNYGFRECPNPSEKFYYSRTDPSTGQEISYDPLKEELVLTPERSLQKRVLSQDEQKQALINYEVYVIETQGTNPNFSLAIADGGVLNFKADGNAKFSYKTKCDGGYLTLRLYKVA